MSVRSQRPSNQQRDNEGKPASAKRANQRGGRKVNRGGEEQSAENFFPSAYCA